MRKLFTIIAILTLLIFPVSSFADSSATAEAEAVASQNVGDITINFPEQKDVTAVQNNGRGYRGFNNPAEMNYPGQASYFGPATRNHNVQSAKTMVMYKDTFTRAEVEAYLKGTSVEHDRKGDEIADKDKTADQTIRVVIDPPAKGTVVQTALITTSAKNKDTESKDALYAALLSGLDSGADILLITSEGASTILKSFGWGIGLSYTRSSISDSETVGGTAAGGMGISGSTAGYKSLPWLQSIGLKLK